MLQIPLIKEVDWELKKDVPIQETEEMTNLVKEF